MTDISRIKDALKFLKDNQGLKVGNLFLSCKDNIVYVAGFTNYSDLKNINKRIAVKELEETKVEFKESILLVPEFNDFLKNKLVKYILSYDYGMGAIEICNEINAVLTWEYQLVD